MSFMNYLAHLVLSGDNEDVIFGNFIGDVIKGKDYNKFPKDVKKGILLHREIDSFTDSHPIYLQSKRRFYDGYPKISGVITDILYDHLLSLEWEQHVKMDLSHFIDNSYRLIDSRQHQLPEKMLPVYNHMRTNDWFRRYQSKEGTALSLMQIGRRIGFGDNIGKSIEEFEKRENLFIQEFNLFFEEIKKHTSAFLLNYQ